MTTNFLEHLRTRLGTTVDGLYRRYRDNPVAIRREMPDALQAAPGQRLVATHLRNFTLLPSGISGRTARQITFGNKTVRDHFRSRYNSHLQYPDFPLEVVALNEEPLWLDDDPEPSPAPQRKDKPPGSIKLIIGPRNSGKMKTLFEECNKYKADNLKIMVIKPDIGPSIGRHQDLPHYRLFTMCVGYHDECVRAVEIAEYFDVVAIIRGHFWEPSAASAGL